ncbi:hypothetical protein OOU_Y34scaffold00338g1 [Pyricularia oryzae Y34]|uniref:Uncharacterized protein n=2 Tax=Pyricularia oryzae TaxID=318829 RepID=A0AA97P2G1_PYRO3|nr:hypothetical protein OOU_Y34scaffold00338g1 [Pyricularia oryzae Y34]
MLLHHGHQLLEKLFLYPRNGDTATNWLLKRDIASSQRRQDSSPQGSNRLLRPYPAGYSIPTTDCQMSTRTPRKRWATTENNIGTKSHPSNWRPRRDVETSRYRQFCLLMELSIWVQSADPIKVLQSLLKSADPPPGPIAAWERQKSLDYASGSWLSIYVKAVVYGKLLKSCTR